MAAIIINMNKKDPLTSLERVSLALTIQAARPRSGRPPGLWRFAPRARDNL